MCDKCGCSTPWMGLGVDPRRKNPEFVEIYFDELLHETENAYLFALEGDHELNVWIPKRLCNITEDDIFEIPEWLAEQKGLV